MARRSPPRGFTLVELLVALFATLPYGKFAHGIFRCAALLKWSIERRQPSGLSLAED